MKIKFWGVRGSTPTPEHRNSRYGGNTSCLEVRLESGALIILDCGSGLRGLGKSLLREFGQDPIRGYVFLTHFHWDHVQGIPFFLPLYGEGNNFLFHAVDRPENMLEQIIEGQMASPFFPVDMTMLASKMSFYDLDYSPINIEGAILRAAPLNHPQGAVAYRIDADGTSLVFATDTEPGSAVHDRALLDLVKGADLLIYDAQYTPEQLRAEKKGWGHSSWLEGTRIASQCGVRRLVLFHHDPDHEDRFVDGLVARARQNFPEVEGAAEGLEIDLTKRTCTRAYERSTPRRERRFQVEVPIRIIWQPDHGRQIERPGIARNISKSGIHFVAPKDVPVDQLLQIEVVLPEELTGQGPTTFRLVAKPVRSQVLNEDLGYGKECVKVAAKRVDSKEAAGDRKDIHLVAGEPAFAATSEKPARGRSLPARENALK